VKPTILSRFHSIHVAERMPLLAIEVTPVTEDAEAGEAAVRV